MKGFSLLIFALIFLYSCDGNKTKESSIVKETKDAVNVIEYAEQISILVEKDQQTVQILDPETRKTKLQLVLSKSKPENLPKGSVFIQTPVTQLAPLSFTLIGMLAKIDAIENISAISGQQYIHNATLKDRIRNKNVVDLGGEGTIAPEKIIASKSKVILYSDFGSEFPHKNQLEKLDISCIPILDWREKHPLGKAEWIKLMGYLTGQEAVANDAFDLIVKRYKDLTSIAQKAKSDKIMLSGNMIGDIWFAPAGESFNALLFKDAAANYQYSKTNGTGSIEKSIEAILKESENTKVWLNPGYPTKEQILQNCPKLKHMNLLKTGEIWCYSANMNYYWEMSAAEPDKVLEDLIRILHPEILPSGKFYFYKQVK